jgi:diacylglycerol O-acyltransferase / wax synthase
MTLPAARDLARHQIRVMTIAPGTFDTPMLAGVGDEIREALAAEIPHPHRLGDPASTGCSSPARRAPLPQRRGDPARRGAADVGPLTAGGRPAGGQPGARVGSDGRQQRDAGSGDRWESRPQQRAMLRREHGGAAHLDRRRLPGDGVADPAHARRRAVRVRAAREEPPFSFAAFLELVRSRLHLIPRYRQKVLQPPFGWRDPVWVDDPDFDLSYHVRHAALPAPGTTAQLTEYAARILSRQLDRDRPLWELYVIEGLEHGRVALLGKTHHAMIDGLAGIDIATVMLDLAPDASDELPEPSRGTPARPRRRPRWRGRTSRSSRQPGRGGRVAVGRLAGRRRHRRKALAVGVGSVGSPRRTCCDPAPRSPLNQPPGGTAGSRSSASRWRGQGGQGRLRHHRQRRGARVVADATGRYLRQRGARTPTGCGCGRWCRSAPATPPSPRARQPGRGGVRRPADVRDGPDPAAAGLPRGDERREVLARGGRGGLPARAGGVRAADDPRDGRPGRGERRLFNFLVTNVPGPQLPIYCLGSRLLGAFPFTPLAANHSYSVGVTSMDGWINVGITADYDALPDVDEVPAMVPRPWRSSWPAPRRCPSALDGWRRHGAHAARPRRAAPGRGREQCAASPTTGTQA